MKKSELLKQLKVLVEENNSLREYIDELESRNAFLEAELGNQQDLESIIHFQEQKMNELLCLVDYDSVVF